MTERVLRVTVYDAVRRFGRRGYWSEWEAEVVIRFESAYEVASPMLRGWMRRDQGARYVQFDVGAETDLSKRIAAVESV